MTTEQMTSSTDLELLGKTLCSAFCRDVKPRLVDGFVAVPLPMSARDGDGITVFLDRAAGGGWRISDMGETVMRLSYEHDVNRLLKGTRRVLFDTILEENGAKGDDLEITVDVPGDKLISGLFSIGQAASRIGDLSFWTKSRTESTFMDDLKERIFDTVSSDRVTEGYAVKEVPDSENYLVDFYVSGESKPLYIFGVNSSERARLATITMQHLRSSDHDFDGVVALSALKDVPQGDLQRLMYAANDTLPSISDSKSFHDKLARHLRAV